MGRKPRLDYPGGIYHLIQRGNNREYIFSKRQEKEYLLALIQEYGQVMGFTLYGYVIMGNHYHLMIRISQAPLKDIMHRINNKFSRYYNRRYKRTGHVFENRYKGILVVDDRYLLSLLRYIHQNPVTAHMCEKIEAYPWSSDQCYRGNELGGMVDIDFILDIFSKNRSMAIKKYIEFMDQDKKEDIEVFENCAVVGKRDIENIEEYLQPDRKSLEEILQEITKDREIYNAIKTGSRKRYLRDYKKAFIQEAIKTNYTMKEIGASISISDVAVFKIYNS